jgi:hypothetical protein
MTTLEARIRRRLFGLADVRLFYDGSLVFEGHDVVKIRHREDRVSVWIPWHCDDKRGVVRWSFAPIDEMRVTRYYGKGTS